MSNETFPWPARGRPDYAGMRVVTTVPPAVEPVTVDQVKSWGVIQTADDDADIAAMIAAARRMLESKLGQAFITQTKTVYFSGFPGGRREIRLPYPPLQSVSLFQYINTSGTLTTFATDEWTYTANATPGNLRLPFGHWWPFTLDQDDVVQITYICGYGDTAADVPDEIRMYMRAFLSAMYRNRESHELIQGGQVLPSPIWDSFLDAAWHGEYR